jgi:hypothetical protein
LPLPLLFIHVPLTMPLTSADHESERTARSAVACRRSTDSGALLLSLQHECVLHARHICSLSQSSPNHEFHHVTKLWSNRSRLCHTLTRGCHRPSLTGAEKMIRCDLATDWAFADKNAPLYAHMETMERLPIPEVEPTLEMYLHSVRPYLTEEEFEVSKVSASHMPVARCDVETAAPRDPSLTLTRWRYLGQDRALWYRAR